MRFQETLVDVAGNPTLALLVKLLHVQHLVMLLFAVVVVVVLEDEADDDEEEKVIKSLEY